MKELYGKDSEQCKKVLANVINNFGMKEEFYTNAMVVKDQMQPEKEGGMFIYSFPKTIKEIIESKLFPDDEDLEPVNVYDVVDGRNFRVKGSKQGGFGINYKSSFFKTD